MITAAIVSVALLIWQHQEHKHQEALKAGSGRLAEIGKRLAALEERKVWGVEPAAFDDLKAKVEAIRLAQGMRGSR